MSNHSTPIRAVRRYHRGVGAIFAFLLAWCAVSQAWAEQRDRVVEVRLANGMKAILLENHRVPLVTFQVWYRAGSRNEAWGKTGLAHVLEHMMFKGTTRTSAAAFTQTIGENGARFNAYTAGDYACYFETLSPERLDVVVGLEADRMQNLLLRESDFVTERQVVLEERRLRVDDDPQVFLAEQLEATAYQAQPYHWPIIGWSEDLARIGIEDLKAYYRTHYNPANAFIVVVGDFAKPRLLARLEKTFGVIPKGTHAERPHTQDPPQTGERRITVNREALPQIMIGYHAPNLREPDGYVLEVISAILSAGKSARLSERLVWEQQVALFADASYSLLTVDPGLFNLTAMPLPGRSVEEVEQALDQEIARLQAERVSDHELEKAKNKLEASFVFVQDSLFEQAMMLARYEMALDWRAIRDYVSSIRSVSAEDIERVARLVLTPGNRTVAVLAPLAAAPPEPAGSKPAP